MPGWTSHHDQCLRAIIVIPAAVISIGGARAQDPTPDFYKGKVVTLVVTTAGRTGTAHVYSVAPRDGTVIGAVQSFIATDPLFDPSILALFDPRQFNWLGSIASTTSIAVGWHTATVQTLDDLFHKEMIVGGVGAATPMVTMPYLFRRLLGMKFKVVAGYQSGNEVNLAMERGEVQGRIDYSWHSLGAEHLDWIKGKKINLLFQIGLQKHKDLGHVPLVIDLARDEEQRRILEVMFFNYEFGRAFVVV